MLETDVRNSRQPEIIISTNNLALNYILVNFLFRAEDRGANQLLRANYTAAILNMTSD